MDKFLGGDAASRRLMMAESLFVVVSFGGLRAAVALLVITSLVLGEVDVVVKDLFFPKLNRG